MTYLRDHSIHITQKSQHPKIIYQKSHEKWTMDNAECTMNLGFSHPALLPFPVPALAEAYSEHMQDYAWFLHPGDYDGEHPYKPRWIPPASGIAAKNYQGYGRAGLVLLDPPHFQRVS